MNQDIGDDTHTRNLKDFLLLYNLLTEQCFMNCVVQFHSRTLSGREVECVEKCTDRYISFNQRLMRTFMEYQSQKQQAAVEQQITALGDTTTSATPSIATVTAALGAGALPGSKT